jgi:hypothetical protein
VPMTELIGKAVPVSLSGKSSAEPHNAERARVLQALEEARGQVAVCRRTRELERARHSNQRRKAKQNLTARAGGATGP